MKKGVGTWQIIAGIAMSHSPMIMTSEELQEKKDNGFYKSSGNEEMVEGKWCRYYRI